MYLGGIRVQDDPSQQRIHPLVITAIHSVDNFRTSILHHWTQFLI